MISEDELPHKEKKTSLTSQPLSLSSLPEEIIEIILARVPKWTYPNLSLVSKRFLSLISSPQLYKTRSDIGTTEPCLYFCLESHNKHTSPQWFTLLMKPQETRNGEIVNDYSLIPLPSSPHSPPHVLYKSTVAVGSDIYVIGGIYNASSSSVRILDCRSHTLRDAPNMTVARAEPIAVYLDEKIYVIGGCKNDDSANWLEVFDIKTQTWRALPSPGIDHELRCKYIKVNPNAYKGKLYVAAETKDYTYEPKDGTWNVVREKSKGKEWREIYGLYEFNDYPTWYSKKRTAQGIVNYGGKLIFMWRQWYDEDAKGQKFGFSKIALEKHNKDEIWGILENLVNGLLDGYINPGEIRQWRYTTSLSLAASFALIFSDPIFSIEAWHLQTTSLPASLIYTNVESRQLCGSVTYTVPVKENMTYTEFVRTLCEVFSLKSTECNPIISYWMPGKMSVMIESKRPPFYIDNQMSLYTFFLIRGGDPSVNLFVSFITTVKTLGNNVPRTDGDDAESDRVCGSAKTPNPIVAASNVDANNEAVDEQDDVQEDKTDEDEEEEDTEDGDGWYDDHQGDDGFFS
ncbi:Kelch repeat type 1 [Arabidopsis suecica]|uniref:Kelch repeat type 1 n=1 Tax=Arabidopsis suecica TaxID=45249 RepID=A0A8T1YQK3_ARASU|nr:Kelch repeat type 1 [Arabidopsis suecica]